MRFSITLKDIFYSFIFVFGFLLLISTFRDISWPILLTISIGGLLVHILYSCRIYAVVILKDSIKIERLYQKNLFFQSDKITKVIIRKKFHPSKIEGFIIQFEIVSENSDEYSFNAIQFYNSQFSKQVELFCEKNSIEYMDENLK